MKKILFFCIVLLLFSSCTLEHDHSYVDEDATDSFLLDSQEEGTSKQDKEIEEPIGDYYIENVYGYKDYLAYINSLDLPDDFIRYEALSEIGELYCFQFNSNVVAGDLDAYSYYLRDTADKLIHVYIKRVWNKIDLGSKSLDVKASGDMQTIQPGHGTVTHGELTYCYVPVGLLTIKWDYKDWHITISMSEGHLYQYPEKQDTFIGNLLNASTAISTVEALNTSISKSFK